MAAIAIQVGLAVAVSAASSLFAKKPKQQALDRGRLDDLRVQTAEEGAFLPLVYGRRARLAGNIIDGEQTIEHVSHTEGRSGGKAGGGGRAAEPPTNNFTYTKTFAVLLTGNRIKRIRRVNEDLEVIYNDDGSDASINYYEAELAELSGTAAAGSGTSYSGGRAVATGAVGTIKFKQVVATITGAHFLTIYYKESTGVSVTVKTNGVAQTVALPATGSAVDTVEVSISLTAGRSNIIEIIYAGVGSTTIDRIQIARATGAGGGAPAPTGVIDPSGVYPTDIDNPRPFYNYSVLQDSTGLVEGVLAAGGQAPFEFFNGSEEQVQSAALVALHGADATPAYRECSLAVFEDWQLKDGKLGQMTFEVEPEIQLLDEIMVDLYTRVGEKESRLDFSALAGIVDDGFIVDQRTPLAEYITALQVWYNFDVVPCGGQIVAVPRGGASVATITEDKLAAHEEGTKRPTGSTTVSYPDPMDLPNSVDVVYLDPSPAKDYHSATEPAQLAIAGSYDPETLTFPKVGDADTAQQVGLRWLHEKHIESRPRTFVTGPEFRHLIPTDPVTLVLSNLTQRMRIVSKEAALQSLVRFKAVPESAAVYTQTGLGHQDDGAEHPVPPFAANTFLVIADVPPVRAENANQLGYIFGGCPIGAGVWTGYHLNKEEGNGEYSRLAGVSEAATIGIAENALTSGSPYLIDRTADGALVVNMLSVPAGGLESITEEEMFTTSKNTGVYGNEIIRWMTATPETPTAPYVARYRLTGLMHGVNGTEWAISEHTLADEQTRHFMVLDGAVHFRNEPPTEVGATRNFKAQTVGQALADALVTKRKFSGNSLRPLAPVGAESASDNVGSRLVKFRSRTRFAGEVRDGLPVPVGEEAVKFWIEVLSADKSAVLRPMPVITGMTMPLLFKIIAGAAAGTYSGGKYGDLVTLYPTQDVYTESLQRIEASGPSAEAKLTAAQQYLLGGGGATSHVGYADFGLVRADAVVRSGMPLAEIEYLVRVKGDDGVSSGNVLELYHRGTLVYSEAWDTYNATANGKRYRYTLSGSEVRVTRDWQNSSSRPLWVFEQQAPYPLKIYSRVKDAAYVEEATIGGLSQPQTVYSAAQIREDFNLAPGDPLPASINFRIYQESSVVGRGRELEVTL